MLCGYVDTFIDITPGVNMSLLRQRQIIDDLNYYNDPRTRAAQKGTWYDSFDEDRMTAKVTLEYYDEDDEYITETFVFNVRYEVCDLCHGKGTMVNPSIDCGGLTSDDWDDDDFEEDYHAGRYDVACSQCRGKRVVPVRCDYNLTDEQKRAIKIMHDRDVEEAQYHAERMAEIRMGC